MNLLTSEAKNKWYPVYTHARAEKKAYEALVNKGIVAYLPLHRQLSPSLFPIFFIMVVKFCFSASPDGSCMAARLLINPDGRL